MTTLTREQIEKMEAGKEMDCLVAALIFGSQEMESSWEHMYHDQCRYSSNISAAWQVVEKLRLTDKGELHITASNYNYFFGRRDCDGYYAVSKSAHASSAPLAICRAALIMTL